MLARHPAILSFIYDGRYLGKTPVYVRLCRAFWLAFQNSKRTFWTVGVVPEWGSLHPGGFEFFWEPEHCCELDFVRELAIFCRFDG